jgi:hypothetical protein
MVFGHVCPAAYLKTHTLRLTKLLGEVNRR